MLAGSRDGRDMTQDATALIGMVASGTKQLRFFESDHQLPRAYADTATEWFVRHLSRAP
jgi:hypothetical protein